MEGVVQINQSRNIFFIQLDRYAIDFASHPAESGIGWTTHLRVEQLQDGDAYAMPLHFRLHAETGVDSDRTHFVSAKLKDLTAWTEDRVISVELDPFGWVLKDRVEETEIDLDDDGWPDWLDDCPESSRRWTCPAPFTMYA